MKNSKQMELDLSTLSLEAILANHSPLQVEKKVKKIRDISGQSILGLSKSVGRLGSLEKTLVGILNSVSTPYSRTWRVKVTPLGRLVFQLRASVQTTKEKESGLWQTPTAVGIKERSTDALERKRKKRLAIGRSTVPPGSLMEQIQFSPNKDQKPKWDMWRTPDAHSDRGASSKKRMKMKLEKKMPISLNDQVAHPQLMWPTPRAKNFINKKERITPKGRLSKDGKQKFGLNLQDAVTLWPTPCPGTHARGAYPHKGVVKSLLENEKPKTQALLVDKVAVKEIQAGRGMIDSNDKNKVKMWPTPREFMHKDSTTDRGKGNLGEKVGGQLNPTWVEWLMGYPTGWTDLKD